MQECRKEARRPEAHPSPQGPGKPRPLLLSASHNTEAGGGAAQRNSLFGPFAIAAQHGPCGRGPNIISPRQL